MRYAYDVNTHTKLLDVHKQFAGGLKTVDTDDALKGIFLRNVENLELSEFNFLEKRYGQYVEETLLSNVNANTVLQGYFEYTNTDGSVDKILMVDGKLYLNGTQVKTVSTENLTGYRYPTNAVFTDLGIDVVDLNYVSYTDNLEILRFGNFTAINDGGFYYTITLGSAADGTKAFNYGDNYTYERDSSYDATYSGLTVWKRTGSRPNVYPTDGFIEDAYYENTYNSTLYEHSDPADTPKNCTLVATVARTILQADFQATREVEGVRIEDTLYIFTGTYPIYYKGDDTFYILPIYAPDFLELVEFSHNMLEYDYAGVYRYSETPSVSNNTSSAGLATNVKFKSIDYTPTIPYLTDADPTMAFKIQYTYKTVSALDSNAFSAFYDDTPTAPTTEPIESADLGDALYELFPVLYYRESGGGSLEWTELDSSTYTRDIRSNSYTSSSPDYKRIDGTNGIFASYTGGIKDATPISISVETLPLGEIDLKVSLVLRKTGYISDEYIDGGLKYYWNQIDEYVYDHIILNLSVTQEQLTDYEDFITDANGYPAMWSCNRVLNHYGKLIAYGSTVSPEMVYISHPTFKNYFAHYFTQEYSTEERDAIVKITPFMNILVVQTEDYTWGIKGTDVLTDAENPYSSFVISSIFGTIAPKSVRPVRNYLMFLSKEGIVALTSLYAIDYQYNVKQVDRNIRNIVPQDTDAVAIQHNDQYWINFPNSDDNMTLRYYVDKKAWMKDTYFTKTNTIFQGVFKYLRRTGQGLTYISHPIALDGGNYDVYEVALEDSIPTDLGEDQFTMFETAYLDQNYPFHPKGYKECKLEFTLQNEYNLSLSPLFTGTRDALGAASLNLVKQHIYQIDTGVVGLESLDISLDGTPQTLSGTDGVFEFTYTDEDASVDLDITYGTNITVSVYDKTYDDNLTFAVWVISEERTLNLDNIDSYTADLANITENLGTKQGTWTFGETYFGDKVNAIKTIRLAGKGKNIKIYFEDYTKSKWTLESLAILYKMKRARGDR